jgi:gamma-glutamyltranspeptidase/glutathione hydrolase
VRLGHRDRVKHFGDIDFATVPLKGLLSKEYGAERAKLIDRTKASKNADVKAGDPFAHESPNTTHFSVADREGKRRVHDLHARLGFRFGCDGRWRRLSLNNQMNNFSHEAAYRAAARGEALPPNAMQSGKRMMSTMMPTLVFKDEKPWLAVGTPGGGRIINTILQVLVNVIDFKLNIDEATHQPRISQNEGPLEVEPNFNPDTLALLRAKGHDIKQSETMGSAQSIAIENGYFFGAADPEASGRGGDRALSAATAAPRRYLQVVLSQRRASLSKYSRMDAGRSA